MADYEYITATGVIVPDTETIQTEVRAEYTTIFGANFDVSDSTPQGAMINGEISSRQSVARNNANLANQINPNISGGIFLDAVWALTGGERSQGDSSVVEVTCLGVDSTIILVNSFIQDSAGVRWYNKTAGTIGAVTPGEVTISFYSVDKGPIEAGANTLTTIITTTAGWTSCTNPAAATLGSLTQSDASARNERRNTIGIQGLSVAAAVSGRVRALENVKSLSYRENNTDSPATIDGKLIDARSIYVCVDGGGNTEIANELLESKTIGGGWTGAITVPVIEASSGQSYDVKFDRPTEIQIFSQITVKNNTPGLVDPATTVKNAMVLYANGGLSPEEGFIVGLDVSPFELAGAVMQLVPGVFVTAITVGYTLGGQVTAVLPIEVDEKATLKIDDITVTIT
jgi:hypothetical protein